MFVHVHFIHVIELKVPVLCLTKCVGNLIFHVFDTQNRARVAYLDSLTLWGINRRVFC